MKGRVRWMMPKGECWDPGDLPAEVEAGIKRHLDGVIKSHVSEAVHLTMSTLDVMVNTKKNGRLVVQAWGFCDDLLCEWPLQSLLKHVFVGNNLALDDAEKVALSLERTARAIRAQLKKEEDAERGSVQ